MRETERLLAAVAGVALAGNALALPAGAVASGPRWGTAIEVPGLAALNTIADAEVESISCPSPGDCAAGGYYNGLGQGFMAEETGGVWAKARPVPGLRALNTGGQASARTCAVGGWYDTVAHPSYAKPFVADLVQGVWQPAELVPGMVNLNTGQLAQVVSVSCAPAGTCALGGLYSVKVGTEAFVDSQK